MNKHTRNLTIISGIALIGGLVAGVVSRYTTKTLVSAALDREMPKGMKKKKIYSSEKNESIIMSLKEKKAMLENSQLETIEITSHDGNKLIGHWHHNEGDKRIIIAMHGWRSSWSQDFASIFEFWHDNGCSVLYAEQRGQNDSEGEYMSFGMLERYDCLDWINRINEENTENLPIYLAGISMGASTVLMTGGFNLPENVHGIMADCGFTSARAIWKHVAENNMHIYYGIHSRMVEDLCRKKINISSENYTTLDALRINTRPVLFVHGSDDDFVPIEMTYENYKVCKAPKKLFVVPGAGHAMSYMVNKEGYEKITKEFWQEND